MNLIRKIKISKLLNKPLMGEDKDIMDFIESMLKNLVVFNMKSYCDDDNIYMSTENHHLKKKGKYIFRVVYNPDKNIYVADIRYFEFWKELEYKGLCILSIHKLFCYVLSEMLGIKIQKVYPESSIALSIFETTYYELSKKNKIK